MIKTHTVFAYVPTLSQQQCYHLFMALSCCLHQGGVALIIDLEIINRSVN